MNMYYIKMVGRSTMIKRKTTTGKGKTLPQKYRISMKFVFGPFKTASEAAALRKSVKAKVPKVRFGGSPSARNGFSFIGETVYVKRVSATASVLKQALQRSAPNAKITVNRA